MNQLNISMTNYNDKNLIKGKIKSAVAGVLLRIVCFLIYYILLIISSIVIVYISFDTSYYLIMDILPRVPNIQIVILVGSVVIGLCLQAIMLSIYLIKPLFTLKKDRNESRVEVFESECPKLFAMIQDIATKTKCKMPKHVYLTPEVNACVFYDTSFCSNFCKKR